MIHDVGIELQARLRALGCPFPVVDRETTKTTSWARERIVLEHDEDAGDAFDVVRSQRSTPKHRGTCRFAVKATIYAKSPRQGSLEFEHRRRALRVLDLAFVELHDLLQEWKFAWSPSGGRFVTPEDLAESEARGGAVYEFKFTIDRAIVRLDWVGEPEPTAAVGSIVSTSEISLANGPENQPLETGCGG